jgi:multidrug efflux system outer membrane protein
MRPFAVLGPCALLAGCMMGPNYQRPPVDAPKAFLNEPQKTAAAANLEWWKAFDDPVLEQLIAEALANNKDVKIAAANVQRAAGVVTTTRSPLFPQVNYQASAGRYRLSDQTIATLPAGISNPTDLYQVSAGASWEIDLWGRIRRLTESAQAGLFATEEARRGVVLTLVALVATDYLRLRGLDAQLAMARSARDAYAESLRLMEVKFQYGRVSQMNVEQARASLETAEAQIPLIRRDIAILEDALSILLGRNPGTIPRGKDIFAVALPEVPAGLPSELLERRPDILQSEQQLVAANAQIGAAKALYFPTISLTGALGTSSTDLDNLFGGSTRSWNFVGNIIGPIFTGGAISGQVQQAEAGRDAALLAYQKAIQQSFADVEDALINRRELAEQVAAQERLVTALRGYEQFAQTLYDGGRESYTTVLQAQQQLFPAQLTWASGRAALCITTVDIYKAMGGGWIDSADKLTGIERTGSNPPSAAAR